MRVSSKKNEGVPSPNWDAGDQGCPPLNWGGYPGGGRRVVHLGSEQARAFVASGVIHRGQRSGQRWQTQGPRVLQDSLSEAWRGNPRNSACLSFPPMGGLEPNRWFDGEAEGFPIYPLHGSRASNPN